MARIEAPFDDYDGYIAPEDSDLPPGSIVLALGSAAIVVLMHFASLARAPYIIRKSR